MHSEPKDRMKHILFVDDEPNVLDGLKRMLFPLRHEWHMMFATGGGEALRILEGEKVDIIVSDMRMPGMDGAQLLAQVRMNFPEVVRFILTGQTDLETVYRCMGDAHQFLMKPCKPQALKECVDKTFALRGLFENDDLRSIASKIGALPPLPGLYEELRAELQSPAGSISSAAHIIERDVGMTAKVLQLVNSAFFGSRQHVTTALQAVSLLGFERIRALVLMTGLFDRFATVCLPQNFSLAAFQQHSLCVGECARAIAVSRGAREDVCSDSFTGGVLHDCGFLLVLAACPDQFDEIARLVHDGGYDGVDAERQILGCTHADLGAYLLGIWGVPDPVVAAVAYHVEPSAYPSSEFSTVTAVHIADVLACVRGGTNFRFANERLDTAHLSSLGLNTDLETWTDVCAKFTAPQDIAS